MEFKIELNMLHLRRVCLFFLFLIISCKAPEYSVVEPFHSISYGDSANKSTKEGSESELSMAFNLPKVLELKVEGNSWLVKLRLNGRCEAHSLKWLEISECNLEVRDMTTKDKCMGYQIVTERLKRNKDCDEIFINGIAYSNKEEE
tara:strand:- start:2071 stop:2508 length:438 start_codon:yes stop_codon:yes gene_type:complete